MQLRHVDTRLGWPFAQWIICGYAAVERFVNKALS